MLPLSDAVPTIAELRVANIEAAIAKADEPACWAYVAPLLYPLEALEPAAAKAFALIGFAVNLDLDPSDDACPLKPGRSYEQLGTDALTSAQIAVIVEWLPEVSDPELRARLAEILWNVGPKPKHRFGKTAATAYGQSALRYLSAAGLGHQAVHSLERAMTLAFKFGILTETATLVAAVLEGKYGPNIGGRDAALLRLQLKHKTAEPSAIADVAEREALSLEQLAKSETYATNLRLGIARDYWDVVARARAAVKGATKEWVDDAKLRAAETHVEEANKARDANLPWVEESFLSDALAEFRRIGGQQARTATIEMRMVDARRRGNASMVPIAFEVISETGDAASSVANRPLREALTALATVAASPSKSELRRETIEHLTTDAATRFVPSTIVTRDARLVAHAPAYTGKAEAAAEEEATILVEMYQRAEASRLRAIGRIVAAAKQIALDHNPSRTEIATIVRASPVVPRGHEGLFTRGLHAGLHGDYEVAIHLLLPQLENGLRAYIETVIGRPMVKHADDGTQTMNLFSRVLAQPELVSTLGEDLIFDLESLLLKQASTNLRNNTCHGLLADDDVGVPAIYAWWLCLRVCMTLTPLTSVATPAE